MKTSVIAYVYAVIVASATALVGTYWFDPVLDWGLAGGAFALTLVAFLGAVFNYRVQGNTFGEVSFIPYLTAIVLYPSWLTIGVVGLGALVAELIKPKSAIKRAFNVAQIVLASAASVAAYTSLGGVSLQIR